jgi:hypothetical protein
MTQAPKAELEIPLEDEDADPLFEKADALIQRHASFAIDPELDDLPVLTDVVETPPPASTRPPRPNPPNPPSRTPRCPISPRQQPPPPGPKPTGSPSASSCAHPL